MKIGIVSFAHSHAISYARILRDRDDVELLTTDTAETAADGEPRGRRLADELGVPYTDSIDAFYAWQPDAVIVTSENARHLADVTLAAEAGAHVLCEKPLATTVTDAERLVEACLNAGVRLMTAFPVRFAQEFATLKALVDNGALGAPLTVSGTNNGKLPAGRSWFTDPALAGGGAVADHTVHIADLLFTLFPGDRVTEVFATANNILHPTLQVETAGLVSLQFSSGVTAVIDCSWSVSEHYPTWGGLTLHVVGDQGDMQIAPFEPHVEGFSETDRAPLWLGYGSDLDGAMLDEFVSALREDRQPLPSGEDGLRCVEVVAAAYQSIRTGRPEQALVGEEPVILGHD